MSDASTNFADLRVSTLRKASRISSLVDRVTLGPESSWTDNAENERNSCNVPSAEENGAREPKSTSEDSPPPPPPRSAAVTFSVKKILLEKERQRLESVRRAVERKRSDMTRNTSDLRRRTEAARRALTSERESQEAEELRRLEAEEERLARQCETERRHERLAQDRMMRERKERLERQAEEQRRSREQERLAARAAAARTSFRDKCREIGARSRACGDKNSATLALTPLAERLKDLGRRMEAVHERTASGRTTVEDVAVAEDAVRQSEEIYEICKSEIERIDARYELERAEREEAARRAEARLLEEAAVVSTESRGDDATDRRPTTLESGTSDESSGRPPPELRRRSGDAGDGVAPIPAAVCEPDNGGAEATATATAIEPAASEDAGYSEYESLRAYAQTRAFLSDYAESYRDLAQASSLKKFRFECQKAMNIPVNAISGVNGAHLREKYETLQSLLTGRSSPNVTQHPQGVAFCKDILAKKIVSQGETLISSKPEMAFPVAAVALALWKDYPDFGELLLAHLRRACPYVQPVFLPRLEGQSNEEYYRSLGYKYSEDGVVEKQDKYLTRVSGLVRLYASIMVTGGRRASSDGSPAHPHGIRHAWRWLASVLNAEARTDLSDVCATVILDVLEVAGDSLWRAYPRQFPKMLVALATRYYPRMRNEAGIGGGPMARLEQFLKDCLRNESIAPPEGQLPPNFW